MSRWRFGRGWSEDQLRAYLAELKHCAVTFDTPIETMTSERGWTVDGVRDVIALEQPGPVLPHGPFANARQALINYDFSDPRIVVGHFDPGVPLEGRDMLLEIKVFGLRFLGGVRVHSVRDETNSGETIFGFRYDTLEGHFERGLEWFLIRKDHASGEITCTIEARWKLGEFPTWWSRVGFLFVGSHFRELWRRRAVRRLRRLSRQPASKLIAPPGVLAHRGDKSATRTLPKSSPRQ